MRNCCPVHECLSSYIHLYTRWAKHQHVTTNVCSPSNLHKHVAPTQPMTSLSLSHPKPPRSEQKPYSPKAESSLHYTCQACPASISRNCFVRYQASKQSQVPTAVATARPTRDEGIGAEGRNWVRAAQMMARPKPCVGSMGL